MDPIKAIKEKLYDAVDLFRALYGSNASKKLLIDQIIPDKYFRRRPVLITVKINRRD